MADNRILLTCGEDEITLAKCHGHEWRTVGNLGEFLTRHAFSDDPILITTEHGREYLPELKIVDDDKEQS